MAKKNQKFTPLSNIEASSFCSQIAMILRSGISALTYATNPEMLSPKIK